MNPLSGKVVCKLLRQHGWTLDHVNGSHHIFTQPGNPIIVTVPVSRE